MAQALEVDVEIDDYEGNWKVWIDRNPAGEFRRLCVGQEAPPEAEVVFEDENIDLVQKQRFALEWQISQGARPFVGI